MTFENVKFILITVLSGFVVSFLVTYLGIKISKILIIVGLVLFVLFFFFVNGNYDFYGINVSGIFKANLDKFGNQIFSMKQLLFKNIPLTIGIIVGAIYGFKKAI